jgi:hypothetical protein
MLIGRTRRLSLNDFARVTAIRSPAVDCNARVVSPGASDTQMFAAFTDDYRQGRKIAANTPAPSVAGMITVIDKLEEARATEGILNYDGTVTAW